MGSEATECMSMVEGASDSALADMNADATSKTVTQLDGSSDVLQKDVAHKQKQIFIEGSPNLLDADDVEEVRCIIEDTLSLDEKYSDKTKDEITAWMFSCAKKMKAEVSYDDKRNFFAHTFWGRIDLDEEENEETHSTLLHYTVRLRKTVESLLLLSLLSEPTVIDQLDNMPLHFACAQGQLGMVKYMCSLLHNNPKLISSTNDLGRVPAHYAAMYGHIDVLRELMRMDNAVLDAADNSGFTVAWWTMNSITFNRAAECVEHVFAPYYNGEANSAHRGALLELADKSGNPMLSDVIYECSIPMLNYLIELGVPPARRSTASSTEAKGRSKTGTAESTDMEDAAKCVITVAFLWAEEVRFMYMLKRFGVELLIERKFAKHIAVDADIRRLCERSTEYYVPQIMQKVMLRACDTNKSRSRGGARRGGTQKGRKLATGAALEHDDAAPLWTTTFDELKQLDIADGNERGFVLVDFLDNSETKRRLLQKLILNADGSKSIKMEDDGDESGSIASDDELFTPSKKFGYSLESVGKRAANRSSRVNAKQMAAKIQKSFTYATEVQLSEGLQSVSSRLTSDRVPGYICTGPLKFVRHFIEQLCRNSGSGPAENIDRLPLSVRDERVSQFWCDCMHVTVDDNANVNALHCARAECECNKAVNQKFKLKRHFTRPLERQLTTLLPTNTVSDDDFCATAAAVPVSMHAHALIVPCAAQCLCEVALCPLSVILQRPAVYLTVAQSRSASVYAEQQHQWNLFTRERIYAGQYVGMVVGEICTFDELQQRQLNVRSSRSSRRPSSARGDRSSSVSSSVVADTTVLPEHVMPIPIPVEFVDKVRALWKQSKTACAESAQKLLKHFDIYVDQRDRANYTRFIRNEPTNPNLTYHLAFDRGEERVCRRWLVLFARRQIEADEELTFDFASLQRHSFAALTNAFSADDNGYITSSVLPTPEPSTSRTSSLLTTTMTDATAAAAVLDNGLTTRSSMKRKLVSPNDDE